MDIFAGKKKLISYLPTAFLLVSLSLLVVWILSILPIGFDDFDRVEGILFSLAFGYFSSFYVLDNARLSLPCAFAVTLSSAVFSTFSGFGYSIVFCIVLGISFAYVCSKMNLVYSIVSVVLLGAVVGIIFGELYDSLYDLLRHFASAISGKGAVFGVVNDFYSLFLSNSFSDLFYHYDYSSAQVVEDKIVSGVVNIFGAGVDSPLVAKYLTGKYFVNISLSIGAFVLLFSKLTDKERLPLIFVLLLSVIVGDSRLMSAVILLYNPIVYLGYLVCVFISYFVARFVDIRIGFVDSASVVELFRYNHSWIYFLLTGAILSVLTYFVMQIVLSKFDFDKRRVLPREARRIVTALGGERNIERVRNGKVYVINPNLIDILRLDCDIHGNEITLIQNDLDILQDYY